MNLAGRHINLIVGIYPDENLNISNIGDMKVIVKFALPESLLENTESVDAESNSA